MANQMNMVPEFTTDDQGVSEEREEVKETATEEAAEEETETPGEPPAQEEPLAESEEDAKETKAVQGLQEERVKLLKEISELRGQRREIKEQQLLRVEEKIDELKDIHPEDVTLIEKVLRAKGMVTKDEANHMFYEAVQDEELKKFLEKYPEYKPENDRNDLNWSTLQREFGLYKRPDNPHQIGELLERAHRAVVRVPSDRGVPAKKRQVEVASVGSGGARRSSSHSETLNPRYREELLRGGWSEEEVDNMKL